MVEALPKLPTAVEAIVITAANTIAQALPKSGGQWAPIHDAPQELYTMPYLIRQQSVEAPRRDYEASVNRIIVRLETS